MPQQLTSDNLLYVGEVIQITFNWAAVDGGPGTLPSGETISSSSWSVPTGASESSNDHDDTTAWIFLSGDSAGAGELTNTIVTSSGRTLKQTITVRTTT